jgi:hypothetical protein
MDTTSRWCATKLSEAERRVLHLTAEEVLQSHDVRRIGRGLVGLLLGCGVAACGDPFATTSAGFTLTSTSETGVVETSSGTNATWRVGSSLNADGFTSKKLSIDLVTDGGADLLIRSESGRLTGSSPGLGSFRVGDGRNGTVLLTYVLSTGGRATTGGVVITGTSESTAQGHLDAWFGTPGTGSQDATHLVGDFTAKAGPT